VRFEGCSSERSYMIEDENGSVWRVSKAIIRKYTGDFLTRWDVIAGVED